MFDKDPNEGKPYPANEQEGKELVANVIKFIHSEEVSRGLTKALREGEAKPIETIAQLAALATKRAIGSMEKSMKRDVPSQTELGVLTIVVEELYTMAKQMGLEVTPEMVQNSIQIGSNMYNQILEQEKSPQKPQGAMQGPQQGQQPQGPPQGGAMQGPGGMM